MLVALEQKENQSQDVIDNNKLRELSGKELDNYIQNQLSQTKQRVEKRAWGSTSTDKTKKVYKGLSTKIVKNQKPIQAQLVQAGQSFGEAVRDQILASNSSSWEFFLKTEISRQVSKKDGGETPFISFSDSLDSAKDFGDCVVQVKLPSELLVDIESWSDYGIINIDQGGMSLSGVGIEQELTFLGGEVLSSEYNEVN